MGNCINNRNDEEAVARRRKNGWICGSPRRTRGPGLWRVLEGGKQFMAPRLVAIRCSPKHGWPGWLEEVVQRFIYCHAGIHVELVYVHVHVYQLKMRTKFETLFNTRKQGQF